MLTPPKKIVPYLFLLCSGCATHTFSSYTPAANIPTNNFNDAVTERSISNTMVVPDEVENFDPNTVNYKFKKPASAVYLQNFYGVVRAASKTTPSGAPCETYNSVGELIETLPYDADMKRQISDYTQSQPEEDRNVFLTNAFIFYIAKEADGDFHLIIGDTINGERKNCLTIEVSGLPIDTTNDAYDALRDVRRMMYEQFPEFFVGKIRNSFRPVSRFPEIEVRGSLFFDPRHSAGERGTGNIKPVTSWEIHPVTYIKVKK